MSARAETAQLYRSFLKMRYSFPNKQARSVFRRVTTLHFSLKQLRFERLVREQGREIAEREAAAWRKQAAVDLDFWHRLGGQSEAVRRAFTDRVIDLRGLQS